MKRGPRPNWVKKSPSDEIVDNVIDSEDKYKRNLDACVKYYIGPLRRQAARIGLSDREVNSLVSNFEDLAEFHSRTMFPALSHRNVIDAWMAHIDDLRRLYTGYMSSFADSIHIQAVLHSNAEYRKFIQGQRMERTTGYLDLTSYLQFPVTRVTAYAKCVLELIKITPSNSPNSQRLTACFDQLRAIAEAVDKVKKDVQADLQSGRLLSRVRQTRGDGATPGAADAGSNGVSRPPMSPPSPPATNGRHIGSPVAPPAGPPRSPPARITKPMVPPPAPIAATSAQYRSPPMHGATTARSPPPPKPLPALPGSRK